MELVPEIEKYPEVKAVLGMLAVALMKASHDTGKSFYVDTYPVNPGLPDEYAHDFVECQPKEVA